MQYGPKRTSHFSTIWLKQNDNKSKQCLGCLAVEKIYVAGYSWWSYYPWGFIAWGHDKAYISQRQDAAAGTQTTEPLVILTASLFSFVVGEHEMRSPCTCYHLNYHCRWKILLILINLNKQQGINIKNTVLRGKTRYPRRNLAQKICLIRNWANWYNVAGLISIS